MKAARLLSPSILASFVACLGCEDDRPYTPFEVASALPSATQKPTLPPAPTTAAANSFAKSQPIRAPRQARQWQLAGNELMAPEGFYFEHGLVADFNQDGNKETVVWVKSKEPLTPPALWLYAEGKPVKKLFELPGFVPGGENCSTTARLDHTGPHTMVVDSTARCETRLIARAPVRSLAVIAPLQQKPLVLALRAALPAPGEKLDLSMNTVDQDADGRDDIVLTASLETNAASKRPAVARFLWYDREAGPSRDDGEPGLSFARIASLEWVRAGGQKTGLRVPEAIGNLRRLYGTLCAESGTPRIFDAEGHPLECGRLTTTFSRAVQAQIKAAIGQGHTVEAFGFLVRDAWFGHASDEKELQARLHLFQGKLRTVENTTHVWLSARPPRRGTMPRLSPLSFMDDDTLVVNEGDHTARYTSDGKLIEPEEGTDPLPPWPLTVASEGRKLWSGVLHSCDRSEVMLTFLNGDGQPMTPERTNLLAPRPGTCNGTAKHELPLPVPLGFSGERLQAWVSGSLVGPRLPVTRPLGSPLSPNKTWIVVPTQLGLLLHGPRLDLWKVEGLDPPEGLTDCTVSNGARRVACTLSGRVVVIRPEAPERKHRARPHEEGTSSSEQPKD